MLGDGHRVLEWLCNTLHWSDIVMFTGRQVDTKASKGRKLRYDVHSKLVNFMPAVSTATRNQ